MEQDKADKAKGQQADNKSFLAKYVSFVVHHKFTTDLSFMYCKHQSSKEDPI